MTDLGGGYLRQNLQVKDDHLIRGVGEGLEEDREDVVDVFEHLHGDLDEEVVDPPEGGDLAGHCTPLELLGEHLHHRGKVKLVLLQLLLPNLQEDKINNKTVEDTCEPSYAKPGN